MKRNAFILIVLLSITSSVWTQTTISNSFVHNGITRTYSFYVPASYVHGNAVPMVIGLHGTSSSGSDFAQYRDFRPIADTANFIVVHPDGSTFLGISFWNYGDEIPSSVDDIGFIEALIDTISAQYTINQNRIYCTGMSNGSFLSYTLACQSDRFAAIAGVTGSMSTSTYNTCNPANPIPTMHIHGTEDGVNPYAGNSTMIAIEDVSLFWATLNNCNMTPVITAVPDIDTGDGATAERYLYENGTDGHTVELFKVTGGEHTWPGSPMPSSTDVICMDFDARVEIWRFFSQYELSGTNSIVENNAVELVIYPNPAQDQLFIQTDNIITNITITDMQGRVVEKHSTGKIQSIDIHHLKPGNYLIEILGNNMQVIKKLTVSH